MQVHYGYVERRGNIISPIHDIAIVTLDRDITRFVLGVNKVCKTLYFDIYTSICFCHSNKPKMAYSRNAFTRDQQETRERDKTRARLRSEDGPTQSNKIAGENQNFQNLEFNTQEL